MFINGQLCLFLLATLLCTRAVPAQQNNPQTQPASRQICLDVDVAPKSGAPVSDLQRQDFTLLDNNVPQTVTSFKAVSGREAPIEVLLVIDALNTGYRNVIAERTEIDKFLRAEEGQLAYPIALALLTEKGPQILAEFSKDGNALSAALDRADIGLRSVTNSSGFYGGFERWQLSLKALNQLIVGVAPLHGRKVMLWVSPGWPLLSGRRVQIDSKQQQEIFGSIVGLSTQLLQAGITLYSVDPLGNGESLSQGTHYMDFVKPVKKPSEVLLGNLALPVLAIQSGGLTFNFDNDIASLLQKCLSDTAPYYEIWFDPPLANHRDEYHHLEIQIAKSGLTARTRQGYYAQPLSHD